MSILRRIITLDGLDDLLDKQATISFHGCQHPERNLLLDKTVQWIHDAEKLCNKIRTYVLPESVQSEVGSYISFIENQHFTSIPQYRDTKDHLFTDSILCTTCLLDRKQSVGQSVIMSFGKRLVVDRPARLQDPVDDSHDDNDREPVDVGGDEEASGPDPRAGLLELARQVGGKIIQVRKAPALRSRPVQPYKFKVEKPDALVEEFSSKFDRYHTGPTAEELVDVYIQVYAHFASHPDIARWSTVPIRFRDHGYRRTAGGFHQFYLNDPPIDDQLAHFFPIPPADVLEDWRKKKRSVTVSPEEMVYGDWKGRLPHSVLNDTDMVVWTLGQMVGAEAGKEGTEKGMRTYINGITGDGNDKRLIRLDIQKSRRTVENVDISVDIDSVLWITDKLKVKGNVNLHGMPHRGFKAPIEKHNYAYVELVWPRTKAEASQGQISSASQAIPISNLLNTHFAHLGKAEGRAEINIVFPRMKHKYPLQKAWETKIPHEVEVFWLENLVYPAIQTLGGTGVEEYVNWSLRDIEYRHAGAQEKTFHIAPTQLDAVVKAIGEIINQNPQDESFTRFGSFFFVMQILGIKLSTSVNSDWDKLWENMVGQMGDLDWEHMEDTKNGELLVDIGFGFHPPEETQLIGFWDVDALQLGFDFGGYARGVTHGVNTLSAIGGIHAEMTSVRRKRTHIAHRLTYNLSYEILRGRRTRVKEGFFPPASAYEVNQKYRDDIKGVIDAYERNKFERFGVQDEWRCRAKTMKRLLPLLKDKVREPTLDSDYRLQFSTDS